MYNEYEVPSYQDAMIPNPAVVPPTIAVQSTVDCDVVEFQPLATKPPPNPKEVLPANDHLYLTLALMCACIVLGFNGLGMACLLPALICSALV